MQRFLLLLPLVLFTCFTAKAQLQIEYGTQIDSNFQQPSAQHVFQFQGTEGDVIAIRMRDRNSPVDACWELYDANQNRVAAKCGDGGIVELFGKKLNSTGLYTLYVIDNHQNDTGAYGLSLHKMNQPDYALTIHEGDDPIDKIASGVAMKAYAFAAQEDEEIRFQMRAADLHFESTMFITDSTGSKVASSYRKSNVYAGIDRWVAPAKGNYTLFIYDSGGNDTTEYGFTYQSLTHPTHLTPLACKEVIHTAISQLAEIHAYALHLKAGETGFIIAKASSNYLESTVNVYDADGVEKAHLKGSGTAIFTQFTNDGPEQDFLITFEDERGNDMGDYYLTVLTFSETCSDEIGCGSEEGSLDPAGVPNLYRIPVFAGGNYTFSVKEISTAIEPWVILYDASGQALASINDPVKVTISQTANSSGTWWLLVMDRGANDTGTYRLDVGGCIEQLPDWEIACDSISVQLDGQGSAVITPADLDVTLYPEGLERTAILSQMEFNCQDVGTREVMLTVTDEFGRIQSCKGRVEVVSGLTINTPACPVVFTDYAPASCQILEIEVENGSSPYQFEWSSGESTQSIQVCPEQSENFGVHVVDANGCEAAAQIYVQVAEIACDNKGKKINICHRPANDPEKENTLCVSLNAVDGHLHQGPGHEEDHLGECGVTYCSENAIQLESRSGSEATTQELLVQARIGQFSEAIVFNQLGQVLYRFTDETRLLEWFTEDQGRAQGIYYLRWADHKGNWFLTKVFR